MSSRIDSHQHFWRYKSDEYPWIDASREPLQADFMPPDLAPLLGASGIDGTVAVQARRNVNETEFLLELADRFDFIRGVVGWLDLRADDVEAQLERFADRPRMVGLRYSAHDEADDRRMLGGNFSRAMALLKAHDLRYDLLLFPRRLPLALELVRRFPEQPFVLDHIAKPLIKDGVLEPWRRDIRALAKCDNVWCKVSGMVTEADWKAWTQDDFRPYFDVVLDCFGSERLMFGSDWPVCTLAGSYSQAVDIVENHIAALSADEQAAVMGGNASAFYQLS